MAVINRAKVDPNRTKSIIGVSDADLATPIAVPVKNDTGALYIHLSSSDVSIGGGTQYATNAAYADGNTGTLALVVRDDSLTTLTEADGDYSALRVSSTGALHVTGGGGGTEYTEDVATANPIVGGAIMIERDDALSTVTPVEGDNIGLRGTAEGALWTQDFNSDAILADTTAILADTAAIEIATEATQAALETVGGLVVNLGANNDVTVTSGTITAVTAITNALPAGTNNIGDVDVVTLPTVTLAAETTKVLGVTRTAAGDGTLIGSGGTGTPLSVQVAGFNSAQPVTISSGTVTTVSSVTAIANALPAGTNAIGKLAANSGVDIGDVTLTAGTAAIGTLLPSDIDVTTHTNYAKKYYTNAGAVTDGIIWSPAAGKRWHVVALYINVSAAATVTLEDDKGAGDEAIFKSEFAANSGTFLTFPDKYPLASGEDAADLLITTSAGNVYVTAIGYEI